MADTKSDIINRIKRYSLIQGSPESTYGKTMHDGSIESYYDIAKRTRKQINYHNLNGEDVGSIVRNNIAGVVGAKVNIQSRSKSKKINDSYEELLEYHSDKENFEVTGRWHMDDGWRTVVSELTLHGGIIVRHHYSTDWYIPYRLEFVGVDMIDSSKNDLANNIQNGLKKDNYGRVIGIYLYDDTRKTSSTLHGMQDMDYVVFTWVSLSQYTAISRFVTILQTLDATGQYTASEVKAAMQRAKNGVYWHTELYDILQEALDKEFKDAGNKDGLVEEAMNLIDGIVEKGIGTAGATPTPKEDRITQVESKTDTVYDTITSKSQMKMAASMGQSQVSTYRNIKDGNYASIKAAISFDEEDCKIVFNNLEKYIINPYLKRLFKVGVEIGLIPLALTKLYKTPISQLKYMKWDILRTSRRVINEKDDATATKTNLETGVTTIIEEYGRRGKDYFEESEKEIDTLIAVEQMRIKKYKDAGLPLPVKENTQVVVNQQEENKDEQN